MVAVSERARELLLEKKHAANIGEREVGLRVEQQAGELVVVADHARADDQVVEHDGVTVLLVGPDIQGALAGTRVDCVEAADGSLELMLTRLGTQDGDTPWSGRSRTRPPSRQSHGSSPYRFDDLTLHLSTHFSGARR